MEWKRESLNLPVFREKLRGMAETGTSPKEPLRAGTCISILKRLREKAGFQYSFTQYGLRRGLLNVLNSMYAPSDPGAPHPTTSDECSQR